jgi:glutamyl-tRNA reductase
MHSSVKPIDATNMRLNHNLVCVQPWESQVLSYIEESRQRELGKALKMMDKLDERQRKVVSDLTSIILNQTFLPLIENFRRAVENDDTELIETAPKLLKIKCKF